MRKQLLSVLLAAASMACAQTAEFFKPYANTDLRLPSVPLVVNDPYFSIWSPYDKLTDGTTRHWTNDEKPLLGLLRVDGTTYRFMGAQQEFLLSSIAPMADEEKWEGKVARTVQADGWAAEGFDASSWKTEKAAWGSDGLLNISSKWAREGSDIYIRRDVQLTAQQLQEDLYLKYSHDDVFEIYINGTKVADTGETWVDGVVLHLDGDLKKLLYAGNNVIAAHCHNTTGGAYADFGLYKNIKPKTKETKLAEQKSVDVLATNTYYTFACGPVELDVVFTAPMLIDDYDLISVPVNYISYQVRATDGKKHDMQLYIGANPLQAVNRENQATVTTMGMEDGLRYAKTGTIEQPILAKSGDGICIDWGYFYMPAVNGNVMIGESVDIEDNFIETGKTVKQGQRLPRGAFGRGIVARKPADMPVLAYTHDFGSVSEARSFTMLGYDEVMDIEYFYNQYKGYWAHEGQVTIIDAFKDLQSRYGSIMTRCRAFDKMIYDDGMASGGKEYAEILSGSYRHVMAAHKLFKDKDGNLLWFSKENNSNGCVNTVDLTYPEAPLFLCYNPELQKAMMTSIFDYSKSGRWTKPFAAHDLGQYPLANKQVYGGDMPLEESGNMLTLAAQICMMEGNTHYVDPYWDMLQVWVDYLVENGLHPANQLCTDDFAGHWAGNCNLAIKAIMGIAGFAELAKLKGLDDVYAKYNAKAKEMAAAWEKETKVKDHYELAYGSGAETWSQKYNMVWDKLWNTGIIPNNAMQTEVNYYLKKQNKYGLPLDCRKDYTKSDWIMWTAAMAPDMKTFQQFVAPVYKYINETESRVPISDWSDTKTAKMVGFKARSVIGGYWFRVLMDKIQPAPEAPAKSKGKKK
ncbi:DUF4965 domain-containing protein [bacterium]|nr:DUF4965 domain-containing protein [bacterium]